MSEEEQKWWRFPQGIVAAATIATMVLGFFYVREKTMWEFSSRISAVEARGDKAIVSVGTRMERIEQALAESRDRINFLERKIDHLEYSDANQDERLKGLNSSHQ